MKLKKSIAGFSILNLSAALLCIASCSGCATVLNADATDSQVVDADTGQPIEGAVVVAYWEMHRGSLAGDGLPCGAANVEEAVTDKDGQFHLPGWGPVRSSCDGMRSFDPIMFVFKSGYSYVRTGNRADDPTAIISSTQSNHIPKPIKLKKFPYLDLTKVGIRTYASDFGSLNIDLSDFIVLYPTECNWKKIPNTLRALYTEQKRFNAAGNPLGSITDELITTDQSMQQHAPKCGSPKAFIEGLIGETTK